MAYASWGIYHEGMAMTQKKPTAQNPQNRAALITKDLMQPTKTKPRPLQRRGICQLPEGGLGAEGGTRTPTSLSPLDPEPSASANSATSAFRRLSYLATPSLSRFVVPQCRSRSRKMRAQLRGSSLSICSTLMPRCLAFSKASLAASASPCAASTFEKI